MRLLLGGGGHVPMDRRQVLISEIQQFLGTAIKKCLFIPYALHGWDLSVEEYHELGMNAGYHLDPIHKHDDQVRAVNEAEAIYVDGGNTFRLLKTLYDLHLLEPMKERARAGTPIIGLSAGANIACPTIQTTNDMPIVWPPSPVALDLIPFQLNTHYVDLTTEPGFRGETRLQRIEQYLEENNTTVVGLREGAILRREGDKLQLCGTSGARIFIKGHSPQDLLPDDPVDFLLRQPSST